MPMRVPRSYERFDREIALVFSGARWVWLDGKIECSRPVTG